jgi:putative hydrolase of the HAD superfamily
MYWERVGKELEGQLPPGFIRFREGPFTVEPLNPEMIDLACQLKSRYRLALCSNALITLRAELEAEPTLSSLFDVVIISAEVGLRKPDPRIFELTADRLHLPPTACLLIDDKPRNTLAAQAVGMLTITFTSPKQLRRELNQLGL